VSALGTHRPDGVYLLALLVDAVAIASNSNADDLNNVNNDIEKLQRIHKSLSPFE